MKRTHYTYSAITCTETQLKIDNCDHEEAYHGVCVECEEEFVIMSMITMRVVIACIVNMNLGRKGE